MSEKENEKLPDFLEESDNKTDDGSDGDDGGFGEAVLELTKKINKNNCLEHH
ncbi:MAG: hypothetical protein J1E83_02890 [Lachnospiraceae bacterium]|nr:hypothetical protein [Lachnospiraceae bacterium]